jgi:hypothetical protein
MVAAIETGKPRRKVPFWRLQIPDFNSREHFFDSFGSPFLRICCAVLSIYFDHAMLSSVRKGQWCGWCWRGDLFLPTSLLPDLPKETAGDDLLSFSGSVRSHQTSIFLGFEMISYPDWSPSMDGLLWLWSVKMDGFSWDWWPNHCH